MRNSTYFVCILILLLINIPGVLSGNLFSIAAIGYICGIASATIIVLMNW